MYIATYKPRITACFISYNVVKKYLYMITKYYKYNSSKKEQSFQYET